MQIKQGWNKICEPFHKCDDFKKNIYAVRRGAVYKHGI